MNSHWLKGVFDEKWAYFNSFLSSIDRQFCYYTKYFAIDWRTEQILSKWPWRVHWFYLSWSQNLEKFDDLKKVRRLNAAEDQMLHEVGFQLEKVVWLFHWWRRRRRCVDIWIDSSFECIVIVFEWQVTMVIRIVLMIMKSITAADEPPKEIELPKTFY